MFRLVAAGAIAIATLVNADRGLAAQAAASPQDQIIIEPDGPAGQINPAGKPIVLTTPVVDGQIYLGDATVTLQADGRASFSAERLFALLSPRLSPGVIEKLRSMMSERGALFSSLLQGLGVTIRYDPRDLQVELEIAAASRAVRSVQVGEDENRATASHVAPADISAYLNMRGSFDWIQQGEDEGFEPPVMYIDGAARVGGVVFESELNWQPDALGADLQRRGSRFVYDDLDGLARWSAGDLRTLARGFQSAPEIAGLSVTRFYSVLEPQLIVRPRGNRSFQLERRSIVEVRVNDQLVRRLELEPGAYDLRDFPFTQGANDVRLTIIDEAGRSETINFDIFLDQAQLAEGLNEFGVYAGVLAPLAFGGPAYSDTPAISGFYRHGISDRLTLGANVQADTKSWMAGAEAVIASSIGSFGGFASASHVSGVGSGWATIVNFQRTITRQDNRSDILSFSIEARSRNFAPTGVRVPFNPYQYIVGASYNRTISNSVYAGLDGRYSRGRDGETDIASVRGTLGWRISPRMNFNGDASYERDSHGDRFGVFLSLTYRLDRQSSLRADYDSRYNRGRLSYQTYRGSGTGAYNLNADFERSDVGAGATVNGTYYANRAELGFSHFGTFERDLRGSTGQRTSLRFGTSLAMADGFFSVGRPIQDGFALVRAHPSLRDTDILVDPTAESSVANTGALGTAIQPSLSSYSDRTLLVAAPDAPLSTNLGDGNFRLLPPYRGGYLLTVGSDYVVSVVGRLLMASGEPLALVSGTAVEDAHPEREPVTLFTNAAGRFGATGLAPGRWRITMLDPSSSTYDLVIPDGTEGSLPVGDLRPTMR